MCVPRFLAIFKMAVRRRHWVLAACHLDFARTLGTRLENGGQITNLYTLFNLDNFFPLSIFSSSEPVLIYLIPIPLAFLNRPFTIGNCSSKNLPVFSAIIWKHKCRQYTRHNRWIIESYVSTRLPMADEFVSAIIGYYMVTRLMFWHDYALATR